VVETLQCVTVWLRRASIFLLAFFPLFPLTAAAQVSVNGKPIIEARGHGEARAQADRAIINLAIDSHGETADEAVKANATNVAAVSEALKPYLAGHQDDIQAANVSINPEYAAYGQQIPSKAKAYGVVRRFNILVPTSDLALAGQIVTIAANVPESRLVGTDNESDPGKIRVIVELSSTAPTAEQAVQSVEERSRKFEDSLNAKLNGRGTIETEDSVGEDSRPQTSSQSAPAIVAYSAHSTMMIKLSKVDDAGLVTDTAIKAGATRLNSVTFDVAHSTNLQDQAIAAATDDAESKAEAQASALHLKLGPLLKSSTTPFSSSIPMPIPLTAGAGARIAGGSAPPVDPGQVTSSADVTLTYATE
jgi:uncharacterized protein YggE